MNLTDEQQAIVQAARETDQNLIVHARAGAGKTSTLVELAKALSAPSLAVAFNKAIAQEMSVRLPEHVQAKTLNGISHGALMRYLRKRVTLQKNKVYDLTTTFLKEDYSAKEQDELYENLADILRAIRTGKSEGWIPDSINGPYRRLCRDDDFFNDLFFEPTGIEANLIRKVSRVSWEQTIEGVIDFDDQILGAALCGVTFEPYEIVYVDEAQDLSPINHRIVKKIVRNKRLIAVGDPCQAIYGFRGALGNSMDLLERTFEMKRMFLTISFRCGEKIIQEAKSRAPDIKAAPWAKPGEVRHLDKWRLSDIPDEAVILCRNNAPLFRLAVNMLRAGRRVELAGSDVTKTIVTILKKLGKPSLDRDSAMLNLEAWHEKERKRSRESGVLRDKYECASLFIRETDTLAGAIEFANQIANQSGSVKLMTGHKSKGLEFHDVWFLDQSLLSKHDQDPNVRYVIQTRAIDRLTYFTTEAMLEE